MKLGPVRRPFNAGTKQSLCFFKAALSLAYQPEQLKWIRLLRNFVNDLLTDFRRGLQLAALLQLDCSLKISDDVGVHARSIGTTAMTINNGHRRQRLSLEHWPSADFFFTFGACIIAAIENERTYHGVSFQPGN